jgi:hypothetical protein
LDLTLTNEHEDPNEQLILKIPQYTTHQIKMTKKRLEEFIDENLFEMPEFNR